MVASIVIISLWVLFLSIAVYVLENRVDSLEQISKNNKKRSHANSGMIYYLSIQKECDELQRYIKANNHEYYHDQYIDREHVVIFYDKNYKSIYKFDLYEIPAKLKEYKTICCNKRKK